MNNRIITLLQKIESLQSTGDAVFPVGLFPAFRSNTSIGYHRADTTIFFSAITCFTLQKIAQQIGEPEVQERVDRISGRVSALYEQFRNKDGLATYNFWRTRPSRHFPNGYLFRHFEHFRIPDDVDDTAFIYLTTDRSPEEAEWLQEKLSLHANGTKQWARNTFSEVKTLPAYSTWFGKNMYIEFDACVLSNILYALFDLRVAPDRHALASMEYIRFVIQSEKYLEVPFRCAHQYPRTELIMYHVMRLIAAFDPAPLRDVKDKLITDAQRRLMASRSAMDRVILSTSLLRFGIETDEIDTELIGIADFEQFYFFIAGLLTAYENPLLYKISRSTVFHMKWQCEAHCWTLLAEYEALVHLHQRKRVHSS